MFRIVAQKHDDNVPQGANCRFCRDALGLFIGFQIQFEVINHPLNETHTFTKRQEGILPVFIPFQAIAVKLLPVYVISTRLRLSLHLYRQDQEYWREGESN